MRVFQIRLLVAQPGVPGIEYSVFQFLAGRKKALGSIAAGDLWKHNSRQR
jgi:hypothetical protein